MSKRSAALVIVALGAVLCAVLAIAVTRHPAATTTRGEPSTRPAVSGKPDSSSRDSEIGVVPSSARVLPRLPLEARFQIPAASKTLPTSEIANEETEERRQLFWQGLREFADRAELTQSEWERLLGDISDVEASELEGFKAVSHPDRTASREENAQAIREQPLLRQELARDLDERLSSWMTERQWKIYDGRMNSRALLSTARRLRLLGEAWPVAPASASL